MQRPDKLGFINSDRTYDVIDTLAHIAKQNEYIDHLESLPLKTDGEVRGKIRKIGTKILLVASDMLTNNISTDIEDWKLPKATPVKTRRIIKQESEKHNTLNNIRANKLKEVCDALQKLNKIS